MKAADTNIVNAHPPRSKYLWTRFRNALGRRSGRGKVMGHSAPAKHRPCLYCRICGCKFYWLLGELVDVEDHIIMDHIEAQHRYHQAERKAQLERGLRKPERAP